MDATSNDGRITVVNGNWGRVSLASILAVLESGYRMLTSAFGVRLDATIRVCRWRQKLSHGGLWPTALPDLPEHRRHLLVTVRLSVLA